MTVLDDRERTDYLRSPYYKKLEFGDFTPFYVTVTICAVLFTILLVINIVLGCCSRYSEYWNDRHTGNRWIVSLWTATPKNQPSLDYTELNPDIIQTKVYYPHPDTTEYTDIEAGHPREPTRREPPAEYVEMPKIESDI